MFGSCASNTTERWLGVGGATAAFDCIGRGIQAARCVIAEMVEAADGDSAHRSQPLLLIRSVFSDASRTVAPRRFTRARVSAISLMPV